MSPLQRRCDASIQRGDGECDVVVLAPDETYLKCVEDALGGSGFALHWARDDDVAARMRLRMRVGVALVSVRAEPMPSAPILRSVDRLRQSGYTVFCYGEHAASWRLGAKSRLLIVGASHVLDSAHPSFAGELRDRLTDFATAEAHRERDDRRLLQQMRALGIVGHSPAIMNLFRWIIRASAVSTLPVLLVGETGTGKELAARAIHALDPRRRQHAFVAVNCGAMNTALAESELFGHRRGAFTGADHDRRGLVRAAHGGVLFLDEIGDLEIGLQVKLLRVLQERQVLALGEDHEVPVDVRIIAATNRDLDEMVRTGSFRADLFHRLSALSTRMPSLHDRTEDTAALVDHFIGRFRTSTESEAVAASAEFVEALRLVQLPGNVRQLENIVHRAMVCPGRGSVLRLRDLPPDIWKELAREDGSLPGRPQAAGSDASNGPVNAVALLEAASWKLGRALDLCEEEIVAAALGAASGNHSRAARLLGISPRTFFNKVRKHRLIA